MYLLYSAALALALLLTSPYWIWQALRHGKYRAGLSERLGNLAAQLKPTSADQRCIWFHAVSVGEVMAITPLVHALRARLTKKDGSATDKSWRIVVSTTTLTGQTLARQRFGEENVFYLPLDFAFALRPFFDAIHPIALILAETEFWPNLLRIAREKTGKVAVVNARVSDRSFPRYKTFRSPLAKVLNNIDLFLAQSAADRERLIAIGSDAGRVQVSGNLKFEAPPIKQSDLVEKLRKAIPAEVLICGSTVEGEEQMLLPTFRKILARYPRALIVLAPRHPERFAPVADLLHSSGMNFRNRSEWRGEELAGHVLLLDSIGELADVYQLATAVFVGGSLVPRGGHNILEPAQSGKPVFVGPFTQNFRDIVSVFQQADAVRVIDPANIEAEFATIFDPKWRAMGERGRLVVTQNSGALQRTVDALEALLWMPSTIKARYQQVAE